MSVASASATAAPAAVARTGQFAGPTFLFGAPLLSVHPIDNRFPGKDDEPSVEEPEGEIQPVNEQDEK